MAQALEGAGNFCLDLLYRENGVGFRVGRTILFIALAALALTIPTGNALQLLKNSPYAFGATLLVTGLMIAYQFAASVVSDQYKHDENTECLKATYWESSRGDYRIIRAVTLFALGVVALTIISHYVAHSWNPLELLKNNYAFAATLGGVGLVVGYQLGAYITQSQKIRDIFAAFQNFLDNLFYKDGHPGYRVARVVLLLALLALSLSISSHLLHKSYNPCLLLKESTAALATGSLLAGLIIAWPARKIAKDISAPTKDEPGEPPAARLEEPAHS